MEIHNERKKLLENESIETIARKCHVPVSCERVKLTMHCTSQSHPNIFHINMI